MSGSTLTKSAILAALSSIGLALIISPALATDVTQQRLQNAAQDPQNWLMVHRDYNNSRHSPLKEVNRETVKDLKLKFMVSIGGTATGGTQRGKEEVDAAGRRRLHVRVRHLEPGNEV